MADKIITINITDDDESVVAKVDKGQKNEVYSKEQIDEQANNYTKINNVYSKTEIDDKYKVISNTSTLDVSNTKSPFYLNFGTEANKTVSQINVARGTSTPMVGANTYSSGIYVKSSDSFMYLNSSPFSKILTVVSGTNTYTTGERTDGWTRNLAFTVNDVAISAPGFNNTSLRELKENIEDYNENALDLINNLKIVKYDYKDDNAPKNMIGVIVDDESTADDFKDESGNAINIYKMISILTKSVQELSKKLDELKSVTTSD